jgi:lipopolysaccharide/colanic/teichoic acid biosynthesis glycosyltransferase
MAIRWGLAKFKRQTVHPPSAALAEPAFRRVVCLERKRAERSRKPFVLMLLQRTQTSEERDDGLFDKTASVVVASIRATDTTGRHVENQVLGVIFVELGTVDKQSALTALRTRITTALRSTLGPDQLNRLDIVLHYFPDGGDGGEGAQPVTPLYPDLTERDEARKVSGALKRAMDVVGSLVALVILSPLFLTIALAIKVSSPGPVLFRQRRLGRHGVSFVFLKFRSMNASCDPQQHRDFVTQFIRGRTPPAGAGHNGRVVYKITRDPRVTRVGRFLRKTSLDELPQLLNVLTGEMSLVGPRPPIPYEVEAYQTWHRRRVLEAKPGITGLWQVNGRSRLPFDDMVRLDLRYAQQWSLWLDLKILLRTPRAVVSGGGAY